MDDQLTISTPEQVAFHYEVAGIGSRFVASLIDHTIIGVALFLVLCATWGLLINALTSGFASDSTGETTFYVILALLVLVEFLIFWGYFVVFETAWNGQTPGKRAGNLRVIRRNGQPVRAGEVMIRNLLRLVDLLPGFYGVGLIAMFIDKDARRLGDFAAGTIVIREGAATKLADVRVTPSPTTTPEPNPDEYGGVGGYGGVAHPVPVVAPKYDPLPGVSLRDVTPDDYRIIREVLERVRRGELARDRADDLARRVAEGVAARMGHNFAQWGQRGWDPLTFLASVLQAKEARE